jgi:hypothetical protein
VSAADGSDPLFARRLQRLREELVDERVPLSFDGPAGLSLLAEITYARRPLQHEGRVPRYGSLVFETVPDWDELFQPPQLIAGNRIRADILRRFADGRSSFTIATADGLTGLANFERSLEDEVAAVRLPRAGAVVVQRNDRGRVRVCTGTGVVTWDGSQWLFKPLAEDYVWAVGRLAPHADRAVLGGLLELAVHSLAAAGIGATLIWNLDGAAVDDRRGGLIGFGRAITGPLLSVTRRAHFAALQSIHEQIDLATVIAADGSVGPIGARLDHSARAGKLVGPTGGARHTSARRFTFDVPGVLAVVSSESGRVTVFAGGAVAAQIDAHIARAAMPTDDASTTRGAVDASVMCCPVCDQPLVVARIPALAKAGHVEVDRPRLCPVCGARLELDSPRSTVLGVQVRSPGR